MNVFLNVFCTLATRLRMGLALAAAFAAITALTATSAVAALYTVDSNLSSLTMDFASPDNGLTTSPTYAGSDTANFSGTIDAVIDGGLGTIAFSSAATELIGLQNTAFTVANPYLPAAGGAPTSDNIDASGNVGVGDGLFTNDGLGSTFAETFALSAPGVDIGWVNFTLTMGGDVPLDGSVPWNMTTTDGWRDIDAPGLVVEEASIISAGGFINGLGQAITVSLVGNVETITIPWDVTYGNLANDAHHLTGTIVASRTVPTVTGGDFDSDGDVDGADFLLWQRGGSPNPLSSTDLALWEAQYGGPPSVAATIASVPEPGSIMLFLLAAFACNLPRRRRA